MRASPKLRPTCLDASEAVIDFRRLGGEAGPAGAGLAAVREILQTLGPGSESVRLGRSRRGGAASVSRYAVVPNPDRPTCALPLRPRRAAVAVLRAHRPPSSTLQRLRLWALMAAGMCGGADLLPGRLTVSSDTADTGDSIGAHLASIVGGPIVVGIHLGPPRANRKPVLQVVRDTGRTVAFAKVGINTLTNGLVRNEASALHLLADAGLRRIQAPAVIHAGRWHDHELLVMAPVDTSRRSAPTPQLLQQAMIEVCAVTGTAQTDLTASHFWRDLQVRLAALDGSTASTLLVALGDLEAGAVAVRMPFGCWHGDWTPWNVSGGGDRLSVWDWERFGVGVPNGFDALHYDLRAAIAAPSSVPRHAVQATATRAVRLLRPFDVPPAVAGWVMAAYLLEIGTRYLSDGQQQAGGRIGNLDAWLVPALTHLVAELVNGRRT